MSLKKVSKNQPDKFEFTEENLNLANKVILKYPLGKKKKCCNGIIIYCTKTK